MAETTLNQPRLSGLSPSGQVVTDGPARMNNNVPARKVTVASFAAAVVQILIWWNNSKGGPEIPGDVAAALTVIATFLAGYFVAPSPKENVVRLIDPRSMGTSDSR